MDPALVRLYLAAFLFSFILGGGLPLVPQHLEHTFGASLGFIGFLAGVHGIMQIVLRLPMGDMADRRGRRRSLVLTFATSAAAGALFVAARGAWWFLPAMGLFGLAAGIFWVAANSYLFDRVTAGGVHRATSDYAFWTGAGFLVGPPTFGIVADQWGFPAGLSLMIIASLAGLVLVATLPETPVVPRPRPAHGVHRRAWRILRHPDIRISAAGTFLFSTMFGVMIAFYPVYLRGVAFSAFAIGVLLAVRQGVALSMRAVLPAALQRMGPRAVLLAGIAVASAATALTPLTSSPVPLGVLAGIAGLGIGVLIPSNLVLVNRGSPPHERGLANGIYGTALGLGSAAASWALGPLGSAYGIEWTFLACATVASLGGGALFLYARTLPTGDRSATGPEPVVEPARA